MTIYEIVEAALAALGVPFACGRYLVASGDPLPPTYLVYRLISSPTVQHADNRAQIQAYRVQISIYTQGSLATIPNVIGVMTAAGFARAGAVQLPTVAQTGHEGIALDFIYQESLTEE